MHTGELALALWQAYFDESGNGPDSPLLCVGGYLFSKESARALEDEWRKLVRSLDVPHFHMTDCNAASGIFKHLSSPQCDKAARRAIELIQAHAAGGVALSVEKAAIGLLPPTNGLWQDSAYAFLANQVGYAVREKTEPEDKVSYIFEGGAHGQGAARLAMKMFLGHEVAQRDFRWAADSFASKQDMPLLQSADILAWHWHKQCRRSAMGNHKLRGDFKALLKVPTVMHHYGRDELLATRRALGLPL